MKLAFLNVWHLSVVVSMAALLLSLSVSALPNTRDTRMLSEPAVSATNIAFIYAGDLWVSNLDGSNVRRLTSDVGDESNPVFSPDGKLIAFNAQYEGNTDVYVVPVDGGVPKRLTYHPGPDRVQAFSPDGKSVLFTSPRAVFTGRYRQLFTVSIGGGVETQLEIPHAFRATYSPDGKRVAYNPLYPAFEQWKRYRGGTHSQLWLFNLADRGTEKIPQPASRANDVDPIWVGDTIYFRSDRNGEFNLYAFDTGSKEIRQLTRHADFPVLYAAAGGAMLIDETAGSGGDLLPWMFRKFGVGPLIGKPTWGGLVGILGFPVLMDGGTITAPNLAFWTREGGWGVENEGVAPDIDVEQTPAAVIAGHDPQLEKAIEVIQAELAKNPPVKPKRPAYPDKSK